MAIDTKHDIILQIELEIGGGVQHRQPPLLDSEQGEQHENEL